MADNRESDDALLAATATDPEAFGPFYRRHARAVLTYLLYRTRARARPRPDRRGVRRRSARELRTDTGAGMAVRHREQQARPTAGGGARARTPGASPACSGSSSKTMGWSPVDQLVDLELSQRPLETLVAYLPAEQRDAVLVRVMHERDYADIAADLGVSKRAARKRVSRGLARLAS